MKKIIVTGVSGQDGSYMAEFLLKETNACILGAMRRTSQAILSNLKNIIINERFKIVPLDLCDSHSITTLIKNEQPDYFINFAAQTFVFDSWNQPALTMQVNAQSIIHICEAIKNYCPKCRFYSSGSSEQWGNVSYSPQDINHPMKPRSIYGVSKCSAGMICKVYRESFGLYIVHGILTNHESERRQEYFVTRKITKGVARIIKEFQNKFIISPIELGRLDVQRDWSHALDFVDGIWKMLNQETPKDYVLSSGETHSIREFVELAFKCADIQGEFMNGCGKEEERFVIKSVRGVVTAPFNAVIINPIFYRPAEVELLLGDSTPARTELGWKPKVSFEQLVERMVNHDLNEIKLDLKQNLA